MLGVGGRKVEQHIARKLKKAQETKRTWPRNACQARSDKGAKKLSAEDSAKEIKTLTSYNYQSRPQRTCEKS